MKLKVRMTVEREYTIADAGGMTFKEMAEQYEMTVASDPHLFIDATDAVTNIEVTEQ